MKIYFYQTRHTNDSPDNATPTEDISDQTTPISPPPAASVVRFNRDMSMDSVPPRSAASSSEGVFFGNRKGFDATNNRKLISKSKMKGEAMLGWSQE